MQLKHSIFGLYVIIDIAFYPSFLFGVLKIFDTLLWVMLPFCMVILSIAFSTDETNLFSRDIRSALSLCKMDKSSLNFD